MKITNRHNCTGCSACADACPKQCITMSYDKFGFYRPKINKKLCIHCNKCISICPANNSPQKNDILAIYKGYAKDIETETNQKSSSGSIFALLAEAIIKKNGIVVGAAFEDHFKNVSHITCETMSQVDKCRGSKYIQSKTQGIYKKTKELLNEGIPVLFSGTPCQIAALNAYLKNVPDNLITVDLVCHGVASTTFYQEYLETLINPNNIISFMFRDKHGNYLERKLSIVNKNNEKSYYSWQNGFGKAFSNNLISRYSCGDCKYATRQRISDISLADNTLIVSEKEKIFGSSFIFINTEKGLKLLDFIQNNAHIEKVDPNKILPHILRLNSPAHPHKNRNKLMRNFAKKGYTKASKLITDYKPKQKIIIRIKSFIKKILSKILFLPAK